MTTTSTTATQTMTIRGIVIARAAYGELRFHSLTGTFLAGMTRQTFKAMKTAFDGAGLAWPMMPGTALSAADTDAIAEWI